MIEHTVAYIQTIISTYGIWGVFMATMMEEVLSPVPSALVPLASGFFLLSQAGNIPMLLFEGIFIVALPVAIGISLNSSAYYFIAYYGGKPLIEKSRRWLRISWDDIEKIERRVTRGSRDEITLVVLRLIPVIPGVALSAFCGVVRYPYTRFLATTFIGAGIRAFVLALIGWQAGRFYLRYLHVIGHIEKRLFLLLVVAAIPLALWYFVLRPKKNS